MASRSKKQERGPHAFSEGPVVRLKDLNLKPADDSISDHIVGPNVSPPTTTTKKKDRDLNEEPLKMSSSQLLQMTACCEALWELHDRLDERIGEWFAPKTRRAGRPFECKLIDVLLFWVASFFHESVRTTATELSDPHNWLVAATALKTAYPDAEKRRLSKRAPSRGQYMRLRDKLAARPDLDEILDTVDDICTQIALQLDLFAPDANRSTPPKSSCAASDGSWLPALYNARIDQAVDPDTDETLRRHDPEALQYSRDSEGNTHRRPGHHYVSLSVRTDIRGVRVPLSTRLLKQPTPDNPQGECTLAVEMTKRINRTIKQHGGRIGALSFDGGMHAEHRDELINEGIIPITKIQRKAGGQYGDRVLGEYKFNLADGTKEIREVTAIDGTASIEERLADGDRTGIALERAKTVVEDYENGSIIRGYWRVPDCPGVPPRLRNARVAIPHNSTDDEIKKNYRRTRAFSVIPETDPAFDGLYYGTRPDTESYNNDVKAHLPNRRCRSVTQNRVMLDLAAYNLRTAFRAIAYQMRHHGQRTNREWFGNHQLPQDL